MARSRPQQAHIAQPEKGLARIINDLRRRVRALELRPDPVGGGGGSSIGAKLRLSSNYGPLPNGFVTPIVWNTVWYDTGGFWPGPGSSSFVIPADGIYDVKGQWSTTAPIGAAPGTVSLILAVVETGLVIAQFDMTSPYAAGGNRGVAGSEQLLAGQHVEFRIDNETGTDIDASRFGSHFSIETSG